MTVSISRTSGCTKLILLYLRIHSLSGYVSGMRVPLEAEQLRWRWSRRSSVSHRCGKSGVAGAGAVCAGSDALEGAARGACRAARDRPASG